jgi:hypothetical protein
VVALLQKKIMAAAVVVVVVVVVAKGRWRCRAVFPSGALVQRRKGSVML